MRMYKSSRTTVIVALIVGLLVLISLWLMGGYNRLIAADENVNNAWRQVETQYQRRYDLIPNLVRSVQGAADFEQETFTEVTEARTRWMNANTDGNRDTQIASVTEMESALSRLLVTVEAYPQLQATSAFRDIMTQLEGTENRIATARRDFNQNVRAYNLIVRRFPGNLLARFFGFEGLSGFESDAGATSAPDVQFQF